MELEREVKRLEGIFFNAQCMKYKNKLSEISKGIEKQIEGKIVKADRKIPNSLLLNEFNMKVRLSDFTDDGRSVIFFHRGSWCPYSNLNIEYLMNHSDALKKKGYKILVISNSLPEEEDSLYERVNLPISVLSDAGSEMAETLGITYNLSSELKALYSEAGIIPDTGGRDKLIFPTIFIADIRRNIEKIILKDDEIYIKEFEKLITSL